MSISCWLSRRLESRVEGLEADHHELPIREVGRVPQGGALLMLHDNILCTLQGEVAWLRFATSWGP